MANLPQIPEAEYEAMKIVWKHAPISANEITDQLTQTTTWSPKTIQTLIKRLVTKVFPVDRQTGASAEKIMSKKPDMETGTWRQAFLPTGWNLP